jgi:hypothetical protein
MLFSRSFEGVFSLIALNFGDQGQAVSFKFPFSGNYVEELHGLENLMGVTADKEIRLKIPGNYGRIWTVKVE